MFLGLDASTQSISAAIIDPATSTVIASDSVNFGAELPQYNAPSGFIPDGPDGEVHTDPSMWLDALEILLQRLKNSGVDLSKITAISGAGQQHASVYLSEKFHSVVANLDASKTLSEQLAATLTRATSPIWMDSSTGEECAEISAAVPETLSLSGSVATMRFTGPQIRKFYKNAPEQYEKTDIIHLNSSFFSSVMAGKSSSIDTGDGAGMNLMELATSVWHKGLLEATAPDLLDKLPTIEQAGSYVSNISPYFVEKYGFSADCRAHSWTGDNPASLVGMGAAASGKMIISLGTSDTLFSAMPEPRTDPNGYGHVFGNPLGGYMTLLCFSNGSLARERLRNDSNLEWADFEAEALAETALGNEGKLVAPFYTPETTPKVESHGVHTNNWDFNAAPNKMKVRALLEGQFLNIRLNSEWMGLSPDNILLTGGASKNSGIAQTIANVFNTPTKRLTSSASSVSIGAAIIAAVANGHRYEDLATNFCATSPESTVPEPEAKVYSSLLTDFKDLLDHIH